MLRVQKGKESSLNNNTNMINVIGLGYIGLPTALMIPSHGVEVIGTDYNKE